MITLVETGVTHTDVASKIIKNYGMKVTDCPTKMKDVNFSTQLGYCMKENMPLKIGHWSGMHTLTVLRLDDFNVLLGIDS